MDEARARRLLARHGPKGYDAGKGTFNPWWWRGSGYRVEIRVGKGTSHWVRDRIVVAFEPGACPHVVVHSLFHEAGHVQMLWLDLAVAVVALPFAWEWSWLAFAAALLAWQFVWREFTAEVYAASRIGLRNAFAGYSHLFRRIGAARGQGRGMSKGRDVSQ